ncbi:MAG: ribbon-helix-helix protein, CopG family [Acidimicrobiia bacterium]
MRVHITLDPEMVEELDTRAGKRRRSAFIAALIRRALEDEQRWDEIESELGSIADAGHAWDKDPAEWIRSQRETDARRAG